MLEWGKPGLSTVGLQVPPRPSLCRAHSTQPQFYAQSDHHPVAFPATGRWLCFVMHQGWQPASAHPGALSCPPPASVKPCPPTLPAAPHRRLFGPCFYSFSVCADSHTPVSPPPPPAAADRRLLLHPVCPRLAGRRAGGAVGAVLHGAGHQWWWGLLRVCVCARVSVAGGCVGGGLCCELLFAG